MNFIKENSPFVYVTGIYYGGHERTWCKYILTRYSDILSRYSGLLSRHGDIHVVKSLYIGPYSNLLSRYIDLAKFIYSNLLCHYVDLSRAKQGMMV